MTLPRRSIAALLLAFTAPALAVPASVPTAAADATDPGPLPATSIVFERTHPDDPSLESLHVLDLGTGEERLLTDIADTGSPGAAIVGSALSPDRRWVLFATAHGFDESDVAMGSGARIVWRIAADGSVTERVSPRAPDTSLTGQVCRVQPDCPADQACDTQRHRCYRTGEQLTTGNPAVGPDGSATYYEVGSFDFSTAGIAGGAWLAEQRANDATVRFLGAEARCGLVTNPAPSPVPGIVLAIHTVCLDATQEGIHVWDTATGQHQLVVPHSMSGLDIQLETPDWLADGSGFAFVARDFVDDETGRWLGAGAFVYDIASGRTERIIPPAAQGYDVDSLALAPTGDAAVVCYATPAGHELWLVPLPYPGTAQPLVQDGRSCDPSW